MHPCSPLHSCTIDQGSPGAQHPQERSQQLRQWRAPGTCQAPCPGKLQAEQVYQPQKDPCKGRHQHTASNQDHQAYQGPEANTDISEGTVALCRSKHPSTAQQQIECAFDCHCCFAMNKSPAELSPLLVTTSLRGIEQGQSFIFAV